MLAPSDHDALRDALWSRLEARAGSMLDLCRRLVRTPSVNGLHPEAPVAAVIEQALRAMGVPVTRHEFAPDRPALVATVGAGEAGLLFVGHMDTVAVGERAAWSVEPFAATVRGGRLYGRGACDNKGGIAVAATVVGVLHEIAPDLAGRVTLCCVPDEESGATGRLGIAPLLASGALRAGQAIYTYPGLDLLSIGHRGLLRLRLIAHGEATHTGGEAWEQGRQGANASTALADLLLRLEQWLPEHTPHPAFPGRRPVVTPGTQLQGGQMESMVPARAEAIVDVRLLPGQSSGALREAIREMAGSVAAVRPGIRFEQEVTADLPAVAIPSATPVVRVLADWTEQLTGRRPRIAGAGPANEGYLLIEAGIPTICGFGPPGGNAHAADEYVEVDGLLLAARIYAATALDLLSAG